MYENTTKSCYECRWSLLAWNVLTLLQVWTCGDLASAFRAPHSFSILNLQLRKQWSADPETSRHRKSGWSISLELTLNFFRLPLCTPDTISVFNLEVLSLVNIISRRSERAVFSVGLEYICWRRPWQFYDRWVHIGNRVWPWSWRVDYSDCELDRVAQAGN